MDDFKLFILNHKKVFVITTCFVLIIGILLCAYLIDYRKDYINQDITLNNLEKEIYTENEFIVKDEEIIISEFISVDIKGSVKKPGVYQIDKSLDRRVSDVITMAGGLTSNADTTVTNLSKKLFDEMVIIIYSKEEVKEFSETLKKEEVQNNLCQSECDSCIDDEKEGANIKDDDSNDSGTNENKLININTASKEELMTLSGIGESKALAIIEYRNETPFEKIEDIMNITGIKESAFEKIKDYITV